MSALTIGGSASALFAPGLKPEAKNKIRPLGALSNYVAERFAEALQQTPEVAAAEIESMAHDNEARAVSGDQFLKVARLDVMMLEAGLRGIGKGAGPRLRGLIEFFSIGTGQPPIITYQDLILNNPAGDLRCFTTGETGKQETHFYLGHQQIERHAARAINGILSFLDAPSAESGELKKAVAQVRHMAEGMRGFKRLDTGAFDAFRVFYKSNDCPVMGQKLAGPSGLYSGSIPALDLLVAGRHLPPHFAEFVAANAQYYPRQESAILESAKSAAVSGNSLLDVLEKLGSPPDLCADLAGLQKALRDFRSAHTQAVVKYLPGVVRETDVGTGGQSVDLLRKRNAMHGDALSRCPFHRLVEAVRGARG